MGWPEPTSCGKYFRIFLRLGTTKILGFHMDTWGLFSGNPSPASKKMTTNAEKLHDVPWVKLHQSDAENRGGSPFLDRGMHWKSDRWLESVCLFLCLCVRLIVYLFVSLAICSSVYRLTVSINLPVYLSIWLCLFVFRSAPGPEALIRNVSQHPELKYISITDDPLKPPEPKKLGGKPFQPKSAQKQPKHMRDVNQTTPSKASFCHLLMIKMVPKSVSCRAGGAHLRGPGTGGNLQHHADHHLDRLVPPGVGARDLTVGPSYHHHSFSQWTAVPSNLGGSVSARSSNVPTRCILIFEYIF